MATTRRERVALRVLQLGAVAVVLAAAPYKTFDLDRFFVPKELALHVCATIVALLVITARRRITLSVADVALAGFLLASLVSAAFATNYWLATRALAISLSGAALFWVTSALRCHGIVRPLVVALAFGVVAGAATALAQAYGIESDYFSLNRAPGGTFGNRNFVAHLAAIGAPVLVLSVLTARNGFGALLGAIGMGIVAAALVMSRSRAAWLAIIALSIPVGFLAFVTRDRWREAKTGRRMLLLGAVTIAGAALSVLLPNRLNWKSDNPYIESAAGLVNYKEGSGRGRLVQYTNSLHMTVAQPLFGVGPGNWPVVYAKYASRNDPSMSQEDGVTSNPWPSSDWVGFLAERGVVGLSLLLFTMLALLQRAFRELWTSRHGARDPERVLTALALLGTLIATAVVGAFDAVLLIAVPTFFFWTLAGALSPPVTGRVTIEQGVREFGPAAVVVVGALVIAHSTLQLSAMAMFGSGSRLASVEQAATLYPGSYRIQARLAQAYLSRGNCKAAAPHARTARALMPNAGEARRLAATCGR